MVQKRGTKTFSIIWKRFSKCSISWGLGVFGDIRGEKSLLQKLLFKWNVIDWLSVNIGGGRIFQNGVMHANMVKPWSCRWGSCGYIGGGRIFRSGGMHADIFNSQIIFKKSSKLKWTHPLIKLNTNKSCYVDKIWLWYECICCWGTFLNSFNSDQSQN
jgi:hypothetical protein